MLYKFLIFIFCFLLISCTGSLSDEQRKQLQKEMKSRTIKKISEGEIMEAALLQAREIQNKIDDHFDITEDDANQDLIKSFEAEHSIHLNWHIDNSTLFSDKEQQLFNAYKTGPSTSDLLDNLQKLGMDSILYTKPIYQISASGDRSLLGMWSITIARKEVIRKM